MKAIQVPQVGGIDVLTMVEIPVPKPKPNEVVVKIAAAGVNFIDVYFREGRYPIAFPFISGQEASGTVSAVGSEVKNFKPGDRVVPVYTQGWVGGLPTPEMRANRRNKKQRSRHS